MVVRPDLVLSFAIYVIAMVGETNLAPFDLPRPRASWSAASTPSTARSSRSSSSAEYINGHGLGPGDHAVPRRLARAVLGSTTCGLAPARGYWPLLWFLADLDGLHLLLHLAARHAATTALRPVHGLRLEAADPRGLVAWIVAVATIAGSRWTAASTVATC